MEDWENLRLPKVSVSFYGNDDSETLRHISEALTRDSDLGQIINSPYISWRVADSTIFSQVLRKTNFTIQANYEVSRPIVRAKVSKFSA